MRKILFVWLIAVLLPVLTPAQAALADTAADLKQAEGLCKAGQYAQAEPICRKILQSDPNNAEGVYQAGKMLARILVAMDRPPQAQEAIEQLLARSANHARLPHALQEILDQAKASGKTLQVGQIYESILESAPGQAQAVWLKMGIAIANAHLGNDQAVESALQDIIDHHRSDDRSTEALGQVAWAYRKLDKQDKARRVYQYVVDTWPKRDRTIFSQRGVVLCSIALDDQPAASAGVQKLLADYADSKYMAEIVRNIGAEYARKGKPEQALSLHQYVVDKHPQSDEALWCQRDIVFCHIDTANEQGAAEALQKLVTGFASNARLPEALADVGEYYRKKRNFANARTIHQEVVQRFPNSDEAILSQRSVILSSRDLNDDSQIEAGIEALLTRFSKDKDIAAVVCHIADRLGNQRDDERSSLYQHIVDHHANHELVVRAKAKLGAIKIHEGDDAAAEAILQKIETDHASHPRLSEAVHVIADAYYEQALIESAAARAGESSQKPEEHFAKALAKWELVIARFPEALYPTAQAYFFAGECHRYFDREDKAVHYHEQMAAKWPSDARAPIALFRVIRYYDRIETAGRMPAREAAPRIQQACRTFLKNYPNSRDATEVREILARWDFVTYGGLLDGKQ